MEQFCWSCRNLLGCPYVTDKRKKFDPSKVITEDNFRECDNYLEQGHREQGARARLFTLTGDGYMRFLHELPSIVMNDIRQGEDSELMYQETPDFSHEPLLFANMLEPARESVLRYATDDTGSIVITKDSEGRPFKHARPTYELKAYITDPEGPLAVNRSVAWAWNTNQCIDYILRTEIELGLIVKVKKSRGKTAPQQQESPDESQARETRKMAGRTVRTARTTTKTRPAAAAGKTAKVKKAAAKPKPGPKRSAGPGPSAGPRRGRPPGKKVTPKKGVAGKGGGGSPAPTEGTDLSEILETLRTLSEQVTDLKNDVSTLQTLVNTHGEKSVDSVTILHDMMVQTEGTMTYPATDEDDNEYVDEDGNLVMESLPELSNKPSKILAYIDGTANDEEEYEEGEGQGEE